MALTEGQQARFVLLQINAGGSKHSPGLYAAGRQQLSDEALKALEECYTLVKDGTIVPASNFNGNTPDNFPGL